MTGVQTCALPISYDFQVVLWDNVGTFSSIFVATPVLKYTKVTQKTVLKEEN